MAQPADAVHFSIRVARPIGLAIGLVIQIAVAVVLFLSVGAAAVLLNLAIRACVNAQLAPNWVVVGMQGLEMLLWAIDMVCCTLFVLREAVDFCATVWVKRER